MGIDHKAWFSSPVLLRVEGEAKKAFDLVSLQSMLRPEEFVVPDATM